MAVFTPPHSADQFEDRTIRILEADHAARGTVGSLDLLEWSHKLDLLCLQIRVGPVDIVDAEGDAADADVVAVAVGRDDGTAALKVRHVSIGVAEE